MAEPFGSNLEGSRGPGFFRRMIESGKVFIWCDEAVAYEGFADFVGSARL